MHGNVMEWCEDKFGELSSSRVLRGGSWVLGPYFLPSAYRSKFPPDNRVSFFGFRVARTL